MALAEPSETLAQSTVSQRPTRWARWTDNLSIIWDSRVATFGLVLVIFWILVGIISLFWTPYPPNASLFIQNMPPLSPNELGGINILGTDHLGRDLASRLMTGTQVILLKTRLPETTANSYMLILALLAGFVSLVGFLGVFGAVSGRKAIRNLLIVTAGWLALAMGLNYLLPDTVPVWVPFVAIFAAAYGIFFIYGWIKAKALDLANIMRFWSISLLLAGVFAILSIPLQNTTVPAFSMPIGVAIWGVIGSLVFGSFLGLNAAYRGGGWDQTIMQLLDALIAFPVIVLYLVVIAALGQGDLVVILAITITGAPGVARLVRGLGLDIKTRDYIRAAETRGESVSHIMFREILPNARGPILVDAMLRVGYAIFAIGTLGFLGIGLPPPDPDWGSMVNDARQFIFTNQWAVVWPAIAIASLVVGLNFFADGLREELTRYQK
jgi:peptide/nickel transport system permease protein